LIHTENKNHGVLQAKTHKSATAPAREANEIPWSLPCPAP